MTAGVAPTHLQPAQPAGASLHSGTSTLSTGTGGWGDLPTLSRTQQVYVHENLRRLGFSTYQQYLDSPYWENVQQRYRSSDRWQHCAICGSTKFGLHHRTYKTLGRERLKDIMPLCASHHAQLHARGLNIHGGHEVLRREWVSGQVAA